jgi:hypothetical protein
VKEWIGCGTYVGIDGVVRHNDHGFEHVSELRGEQSVHALVPAAPRSPVHKYHHRAEASIGRTAVLGQVDVEAVVVFAVRDVLEEEITWLSGWVFVDFRF